MKCWTVGRGIRRCARWKRRERALLAFDKLNVRFISSGTNDTNNAAADLGWQRLPTLSSTPQLLHSLTPHYPSSPSLYPYYHLHHTYHPTTPRSLLTLPLTYHPPDHHPHPKSHPIPPLLFLYLHLSASFQLRLPSAPCGFTVCWGFSSCVVSI